MFCYFLCIHLFFPGLSRDGEDAHEDGDNVSIHLPLVQTREQFLEQRSHSIRTVEQTINDIKHIFQEISHLTVAQDEMIQQFAALTTPFNPPRRALSVVLP